MQRLVILTPRFPFPLEKGDKVRIYNQIKLWSLDFEVHLICLDESQPSREILDSLNPYCHSITVFQLTKPNRIFNAAKGFLKGLPLQVAYFYDNRTALELRYVIKEISPSHIHFHLVRMAPYHFDSPASTSLDYMDSLVLNDIAQYYLNFFPGTFLKSIEKRRIRNYEKKVSKKFNHLFAISKRDINHIDSESRKIHTLSNGVDLDYFKDQPNPDAPYDIGFCGNLGYGHNQKAASFILDHLMPRLPDDLKLLLSGANVPQHLKRRKSDRIDILSNVADIRSSYRSLRILIAPIFTGSGQQNKILEAFAMGIPVITTSFVNESIGAKIDEEIIIADDAETFIKSINRLLSHPEKRNFLSKNARAFVERNFCWSVNSRVFSDIIMSK